jgi:rubrerythrin
MPGDTGSGSDRRGDDNMGQLEQEPSRKIASLAELFALLHVMEAEAAARYAGFASRMRAIGSPAVASVFEQLAAEEAEHVGMARQLSERRTGAPPPPLPRDLLPPAAFTPEAEAELVGSHLLTPYRALSLAVAGEERAFAFWSYVAAHADDGAVRALAESIAHEELSHAARLRQERRLAYRAEERGRERVGAADRLRAAASGEAALAQTLAAAAAGEATPERRAALQQLADESAAMAREVRSLAGETPSPPDPSAPAAPLPSARTDDRQPDAIAAAEALAAGYLALAETAGSEPLANAAQSLAGRALTRLSRLRTGG